MYTIRYSVIGIPLLINIAFFNIIQNALDRPFCFEYLVENFINIGGGVKVLHILNHALKLVLGGKQTKRLVKSRT